jgi:hypothetical protein
MSLEAIGIVTLDPLNRPRDGSYSRAPMCVSPVSESFVPPTNPLSPDLNPVEWVWAHVKRSLANLAVIALDRLEALVRNRLKRLQYRPATLDGFIAGTGLTLDDPTSP